MSLFLSSTILILYTFQRKSLKYKPFHIIIIVLIDSKNRHFWFGGVKWYLNKTDEALGHRQQQKKKHCIKLLKLN